MHNGSTVDHECIEIPSCGYIWNVERNVPMNSDQGAPDDADLIDPDFLMPGWIISDRRRMLFKTIAHLLGYPDPEFLDILRQIEEYLGHLPESLDEQCPEGMLLAAVQIFKHIDPITLEHIYVSTFDFQASNTLYLTAHELGDSRQRGDALLQLRQQIRAAGFEPDTSELPDYIPMLLEFLACLPVDIAVTDIEQRLANTFAAMDMAIAADHPYKRMIAAVQLLLPVAKIPGRPGKYLPVHDAVDKEPMPYPLQYE